MRKLKREHWYESWFDSSYYGLLYGNRNEEEASNFIEHLVDKLEIPTQAKILDLACGRGRHAKKLASNGFCVTGIDLSDSSIEFAKQFEQTGKLAFHKHDMRDELTFGQFDYILNCFTSFGYFETRAEHKQTLQNVRAALKDNGLFVLDYLNSSLVVQQLPTEVVVSKENIDFTVKKQQQGEFVVKSIEFYDNDLRYHFEESVRLFDLKAFQELFKDAGLKIEAVYGDYSLKTFQEDSSPRLILVAKKM